MTSSQILVGGVSHTWECAASVHEPHAQTVAMLLRWDEFPTMLLHYIGISSSSKQSSEACIYSIARRNIKEKVTEL